MSLILDALNKSDRDARPYANRPDLSASASLGSKPEAHTVLLAVIALLALVAVVLLVLVLLRPATPVSEFELPLEQTAAPLSEAPPFAPSAPLTALSEPLTALSEPPPAPAAKAEPESPALAPANRGLASEIAALYEPQISDEIEVLSPAEIIVPASSISPEEEALAHQLWQQSAPQPLTVVHATPDTEAAPPPPVPAGVPAAESIASLDDVPFLHKLPMNFQNRIPTLMYKQHDYEAGFVTINETTLYVGDFAADGVAVEQIMADGAVLSFDNRRFKLLAQSSWVNYGAP